MKQFRQLIKELPSKTIVFTFMRTQPPTIGHALVVNAVKRLAEKQDADHVIYASRSQDKKQNPLPANRKVYYLKRMFPGANFVAASEQIRTFIEAVKALNKKYKNLIMVAGSDRVAEYQRILNKYNGTEFHYDTIEVVSAGERDPDADGASGMSGTKMREAAKKGDFDSFKRGLPSTLSIIDAKRLMNEVREGLGMEAIKESIDLPKTDLRERYHAGEIFNVDQIVESNGIVYQIKKRGSNHLLLQDQNGNMVSKWITDVTESNQSFALQQGLLEMKYTSADKIKVARIIAGALGVEDVDKQSNPEQLVNSGLRKVRNKPMRPEYMQVLHKMLQTADEAGIKWDRKLHKMDIEEGVNQPNGTDKVGGIIAELSPETLKSYTSKAMGSKSAADFMRGVKMAQGSGGEEELRKKSEKRSAGIHTAIKKLTKEELQLDEMQQGKEYTHKQLLTKVKSGNWEAQTDIKPGKHVEMRHHTGKRVTVKVSHEPVKEEVELEEGKMGQLSADIGSHIDKHVDDYKTHGGAEHLMSKIDHTAKKIASQHGLEHKHAHKFVSDYVEKKLHEEAITESHVEFRIDHRDKIKGDHKSTFADHEAKVGDVTDKATYVTVPSHRAKSFKSAMKSKHGVNVELSEETRLTEWVVKHDGVDADHPIASTMHGKKDVINHLTKYKDSAEKRAKLLKDKGFKNVRIEENKTPSVWDNVGKAYPDQHTKEIRANKDAAILDAIRAKKEKEKKTMSEEISNLLEQIANAKLTGKDTTTLQKKLSAVRAGTDVDGKNNDSDVEADKAPTSHPASAVGHSLVDPNQSANLRRRKAVYATEAVTTAGTLVGEKKKQCGCDESDGDISIDEDQATAEYKVKTYYDNNLGKTVTRKVRPHRVTFAASKKNAEPEVDQPGEKLKNEGFDPFFNDGTQTYIKDEKKKKPVQEDNDEHEEEDDDLTPESDLEDMASEIQNLDDIIDVYDDEELVLVDDEGNEVEEDEDEKKVNEEALNEVLTRAERMKARIRFAQSKAKRERKIKIALKTPSSNKKINSRARKLAVKLVKQRLARKPLNKLSVSEKERIEATVQRRKKLINRLAMKLVSRVRKIEQTRLHKGK